jgi:alanine or glycine:cation symporter, AGCS family
MGSNMVELSTLLQRVSAWVWGVPLIVVLVGTGLYLMCVLKGMPLLQLFPALRLAFVDRVDRDAPGDITHFQSLMTALSATVGVGNIAGVATAIAVGGPGALVWMWVTGVVGMATKYAEAVLAVKFRVTNARGEMSGGPMYYIEHGLHAKWLAVIFACCTAIAALGIGNMVQSNAVAQGLKASFQITPLASGLCMMVVTALVLLASSIVPVMILLYLIAGVAALVQQRALIPAALHTIFYYAWHPTAALGGFSGAVVMQTIRLGIARGVFSNESGLGSAPIAAAAAKTHDPVRQALVSMTQTFLDTLVVCSITGLVIVTSGEWQSGATAAELTINAFRRAIGSTGALIVPTGLVLFAYSTILGWAYYGEKAMEYVAGVQAVMWYRCVFSVMILVGALVKLEIIWSIADITNACMAAPNLIALLALSPVVVRETQRYFSKE